MKKTNRLAASLLRFLSRALPDVGPSACLALLVLDKKGKTEKVRCPMPALFTLARSSQLPYTHLATSWVYKERYTHL